MPEANESDAERRKRLRETVARLYADGYVEGMMAAANEYDLVDFVPEVGAQMDEPLKLRLKLVDKAVETYVRLVRSRGEELVAQGFEGDEFFVKLDEYARRLAENRGELIAQLEHAEARLDGAGRIVDEAGMSYEWRFPHFEFGAEHDECPICEEIREGAPYSREEAEEEGFPSVPHPGCDHSWVLVPLEEESLTEKYPPVGKFARENDPMSSVTHNFEDDGRSSEELSTMKRVGYVELVDFATCSLSCGYFCSTCGAFESKASTMPKNPGDYDGYCRKFKFRDRAFGCCDGWYRK